MSGRVADYRLKIGFGGGIGGRFTIGSSVIGGSDIIATDWTEFFTGPYDDVTDDVAEGSVVSCSRGLDAKLAALESGQSRFSLIKATNIIFYDPNEPTSPLNDGTVSPGFEPMRPVQCIAFVDDVGGVFTVTGNEITDATRAAAAALGLTASGQMCDGLSNDSSFGIRRTATNLFRRGQCDATTDWKPDNASTQATDGTVVPPFSTQSIKVTCDGSVANQGVIADSGAGQAAAAGTSLVGSVWFKGVLGAAYLVRMRCVNTDTTTTLGANTAVTATGGWQLITPPALAVAVGKTADRIAINVFISGTRTESFWVAHAMTEKGQSVVSPYVATSGGATATHGAGRVTAPASLVAGGSIWVAFRVRLGFAAADDQYGGGAAGAHFFAFGAADASGYYKVFFREGDNAWYARIGSGAASESAAVVSTHLKGDFATVIATFKPAQNRLSINGAPFVAGATTILPTPTDTVIDIGSGGAVFGSPSNSETQWFACGTGALTDAAAQWLHNELVAGRQPQPADINDFDPAALCTAVWNADTASYTIPNVQKGVFYHFIRDATYDPETGVCSITAEDLFYWMSRVENPIISPVAGITSAQAVGLLLDSFGFTDPTFRVLTANPSITNITFSADGTKSVLDLLKELLDAEQGRMFVDRNGVFHFEDRYARERRAVASASFNTELFAIDSRAAADTIGNRITVTGAVGGPQVKQDDASIHSFGVGDAGSVSSAYIPDGASAADLAKLILMRVKDPHPPQRATIDNDSAATMVAQLAVELQDRVTISGTDGYVERIEHVIAPGGVRQTTTLTVSKVASVIPFQIGISAFADPAATTGDYIAA